MWRGWWSGELYLEGSLSIPVSAVKGTGSEKLPATQLVRLCGCHHKPFHRPADECEGGKHPWSQAAEERGDENLTEVVYGVPVLDAEDEVVGYDVVDLDELGGDEDDEDWQPLPWLYITQGDVVPMSELPAYTFEDLWYLKAKAEKGKKGKITLTMFGTLVAALKRNKQAIVTVWGPRQGNRKKVAIMPVDLGTGETVLAMVCMAFTNEVRDPDEPILAHNDVTVPASAVERFSKLLGGFAGHYDGDRYANTALAKKARLIEAQVAGGDKPPTAAPMSRASSEEEDVLAALERALEALPSQVSGPEPGGEPPPPAKVVVKPRSAHDRLRARRTPVRA